MSHYYKPWLAGREVAPRPPDHPLDKIRCRNGHYRYLVACLHNCPESRYCPEFWAFFKDRRILPSEYYNVGGIGDEAMRRIVIDCDRCGKKDIGEPCSLYRPEGEGPEFRRSDEAHRAMVEACGYAWEDLGPFLVHVLERLESERGWVHYCDRCLAQTAESLAKIAQVKQVPALKGAAAARAREQERAEKALAAAAVKPERPLRVPSEARRARPKDEAAGAPRAAAVG
jgi:hypothetical protein